VSTQESSGAEHKPYIAASQNLRELTPLPVLVGTILGILFGTSSLYLALKVGITISASIPIAVMSISIFRWFSRVFGARPATILENNIVQTTGSAGESIAFGVAVTMPALLILGQDLDLARTMIVAVLGGLLGILLMIPLRRGMIVHEHGKLIYPEGTACAEVLMAGEKGGTNAKTVFSGFGLGFLYRFLNHENGIRVFKQTPEKMLSWFKGGSISGELTPELFGVGYIIGPRIAGIMCGGGVLAYLVLIPIIKIFGDSLPEPLFPATELIKNMSPHAVRNAYVLYIGAGAVLAGGIISLIRVVPSLVSAFVRGVKSLSATRADEPAVTRTEHDLPPIFVAVGAVALVAALKLIPVLNVPILGAVLIIVFGFLFVTVSSRLTGEVGSSSNPISGMTVATLLLTCLVFLFFGWTGPHERVAALMIAAVVCVASSNGGTTSQDLKTGYLVGATPRAQQIGLLIGALASALVIGATLKLFNDTSTIYAKRDYQYAVNPSFFDGKSPLMGSDAKYDAKTYNTVHFTSETAPRGADGKYIVPPGKYLVNDDGKVTYLVDPGINGSLEKRDPRPGETEGQTVPKFDAPKARLMSLIIDGILTRKLPWGLVLLGIFISITLEIAGISSLPFAVGVYLPLSSSTPIWAGGMVRWAVDKMNKGKSASESDSSPGVLFSSGLIAGGAIAGMFVALLAGFAADFMKSIDLAPRLGAFADSDAIALGFFLLLSLTVYLVGREKLLSSGSQTEARNK